MFYTSPHLYGPGGLGEVTPEGLEIITTPCPTRESRVLPPEGASGGSWARLIDYGSHEISLGRYNGKPCAVVHHGGGWAWMVLHGPAGAFEALQTIGDEKALYGLLYAIICGAQQSVRDAVEAESTRWRRAHLDKRIKTRRSKGIAYVSIEPAPAPVAVAA